MRGTAEICAARIGSRGKKSLNRQRNSSAASAAPVQIEVQRINSGSCIDEVHAAIPKHMPQDRVRASGPQATWKGKAAPPWAAFHRISSVAFARILLRLQ